MSSVTQPRGGIPIASVTVSGQRYDCLTNAEFVRFFETLLRRIGGTVGMDFAELLQLALEPVSRDPSAQEALRAVDELRNELESVRATSAGLMARLDELLSQIEAPPNIQPLANRITQIEDRLQ
jgi:hypothetical protein